MLEQDVDNVGRLRQARLVKERATLSIDEVDHAARGQHDAIDFLGDVAHVDLGKKRLAR
jgi:hypothetical protein